MNQKITRARFWTALVGTLGFALASWPAAAGNIELSSGLSFNRSAYGGGSYAWTRRWGSSVGYEFSDRSQIEFAYQDMVNRTFIEGYEDTTFHDEVYSFNWVQNLLSRNSPIQPYAKAGIGQLNREATGSYAGGTAPARRVDSITGVLGGGARIFLTRNFAIRAEVTSYLEAGKISTWRDNVGITLGASVTF
jgi:hypothetical protein